MLNLCFAHTGNINKANLSLEGTEQYQLTISVDILHLLKRYQNIKGDDTKVIETLKSMSFSQQKQLLDRLHKDLTQQTSIRFTSLKDKSEDNIEHGIGVTLGKNIEKSINKLSGLSLSRLKKTLSAGPQSASTRTELYTVGEIPQGIHSVSIRFSTLFSDVQLSVIRPQHDLVSNNKYSDDFQLATGKSKEDTNLTSTIKMIKDYIVQGFVHILPRGLDHILFVLALFLFAKSRSILIWQVSAFTLAHTITLALGIYGLIQLPSVIVEPLIALSILYIALENNFHTESTAISHTRMPVIFSFGLLHGLGFASVLRDLGLPESQYALSLLSFNIGVELGQLSVIAIAFAFLLPVMKKSWYRTKLVKGLNIVIAIVATYWLIERVL
jgi:hypothetical protein